MLTALGQGDCFVSNLHYVATSIVKRSKSVNSTSFEHKIKNVNITARVQRKKQDLCSILSVSGLLGSRSLVKSGTLFLFIKTFICTLFFFVLEELIRQRVTRTHEAAIYPLTELNSDAN